MGERCKLPHWGLGQLCNFYNVAVTKHRIIILIKVGVQSTSGPIRKVGGGGGGGNPLQVGCLSLAHVIVYNKRFIQF